MRTLLENLFQSVMTTRDARFEAARRADRCDSYSTACVAILSLEIIAINLFQFAGNMPEDSERLISASTILLSVFALVLSLIINQLKYGVKSANYHSCALDLDVLGYEINREMKSPETPDRATVERLENKYSAILKQYNLNHTQQDFKWAVRNSEKTKASCGFMANPMHYYAHKACLWWRQYVWCVATIYLSIMVIGAFMVYYFLTEFVKNTYNI